MTEPNSVHGSFTIERTLDATPERVFAAFANPEYKAMWFGPQSGAKVTRDHCEFRVGGTERAATHWTSGVVSRFDARYFDIVPNRRIVYAYEMHLDDKKISVSLATITITPAGAQTRLSITEQGVFLDGYDDAGSRERGTNMLVEQLAASIATRR
jgi:uncharacterized protein YndB with AHSA1/START domain